MDRLYVSESKIPSAGRGVFAGGAIKKGEKIEVCPFIEIPENETEAIEQSTLINYVYFFGEKKEQMLLALGLGSIYNHSNTPNALYEIKPEEKVIEFRALKDIKKGEEIVVNYKQDSPDSLPLWFEV